MARKTPKPCLRCGALTRTGSYCDAHRHETDRSRYAWSQLARRARAVHVMNNGLTCPGLDDIGHEPHKVDQLEDLQADHIVPLAAGGELLDPRNVRIICSTANQQRRHT